jgi:mannose-1-phosphate guanylyltransferase/phosphomannomutase
MKAIILAGGFGTRLRPLTLDRPKHMLPLVDKPVLEYVVEYLKKNGLNEVIISTSQKAEFNAILEYFSANNFGVKIDFVLEPERLGGVGCIKYAAEKFGINETFVVIGGDNITEINLKRMIEFHKKQRGIATIALTATKTPWLFGVVGLEGDRIVKFVEKPPKGTEPTNLMSTCIYVMEPSILQFIPNKFLDSTGLIFPILLENKQKLYGYNDGGFWIDIGAKDDYLLAVGYALKKMKKKNWIDDSVKIEKSTKLEGTVIVYKNTTVGKNCLIKNSVIFENNLIGDNCKITNAVIDSGCKIENNVNISTILAKGSVVEK